MNLLVIEHKGSESISQIMCIRFGHSSTDDRDRLYLNLEYTSI
jgi:hypothetical protein